MKRISSAALLLLIAVIVNGQSDYSLNFHSKSSAGRKVFLASFYGERISPVDSLFTDKNGTVTFHFTSARATGMYRYIEDKNNHTDFIFNKENIEFNIEYDNYTNPITVLNSKENTVYYNYLRDDENYRKRIDLLMPLLDYYPSDDPFYKKISKQTVSLQKEWSKKFSEYLSKNYGSYAARLIRIKHVPAYDLSLKEVDKKLKFRDDFFNGISFTDTALIRSNIYPNKIIDFLSLYANPKFEQKRLEQEFIKAVDILFATVPMEPKVNDFILTYLVGGFEKFKFEDVLVHISTKYLSSKQCSDDKVKKSLASRIEAYEKMAVGKIAPDFQLKMENGNVLTRASLKSKYCLLVFWASWCPHCTQMVPEVAKLASGIPADDLQVITLSLDTSSVAYHDFINKNLTSLLNYCDFKGWDGQAMVDYHIYATPTMFLIDDQRKIISKPLTMGDLIETFQETGLKK